MSYQNTPPIKPQIAAIKERALRQTKLADSQCANLCTAHPWRVEADEAHWEVHELFAGALDDIRTRLPPPQKKLLNGEVGRMLARASQYRNIAVAAYRAVFVGLGIAAAVWAWVREGRIDRIDAMLMQHGGAAVETNQPQAKR